MFSRLKILDTSARTHFFVTSEAHTHLATSLALRVLFHAALSAIQKIMSDRLSQWIEEYILWNP